MGSQNLINFVLFVSCLANVFAIERVNGVNRQRSNNQNF